MNMVIYMQINNMNFFTLFFSSRLLPVAYRKVPCHANPPLPSPCRSSRRINLRKNLILFNFTDELIINTMMTAKDEPESYFISSISSSYIYPPKNLPQWILRTDDVNEKQMQLSKISRTKFYNLILIFKFCLF